MALETDPVDLLVDDDNDIVFENGDLVLSTGIEAITQQCRIVMQMFQGEWFLNLDAGLPYWDQILGQKPNIAIQAATIYVRRELMLVDGVVDILKLETTFDKTSRRLTISWQVDTEFGETPVDEIQLRVTTGGV